MYLYFEKSNGDWQLVSDGIASKEDAMPLIYKDVAKRNPKYTIYYVRSMKLPQGICFDVGSHTEFYWLTEGKR